MTAAIWRTSGGPPAAGPGAYPGGLAGGAGGLGIVGVIIVLLVTFIGGGGAAGFTPDAGLDNFPQSPQASGPPFDENAPDSDADLKAFMRFVIGDVQDAWTGIFARAGEQYPRTTLVLFNGGVRTGCGAASSDTGPFYCPADRRVYLDLGFFRELRDRFGAPGDFAQAYVIAHEVGHHVQNVLGILPQVNQAQRDRPDEANELSVRLELQADCFAGVWAHSAYQRQSPRGRRPRGGPQAAAAIGDDRIASQAGQRVDRETFTHGSSEQRTRWFLKGFQGGEVASCDTFSVGEL